MNVRHRTPSQARLLERIHCTRLVPPARRAVHSGDGRVGKGQHPPSRKAIGRATTRNAGRVQSQYSRKMWAGIRCLDRLPAMRTYAMSRSSVTRQAIVAPSSATRAAGSSGPGCRRAGHSVRASGGKGGSPRSRAPGLAACGTLSPDVLGGPEDVPACPVGTHLPAQDQESAARKRKGGRKR